MDDKLFRARQKAKKELALTAGKALEIKDRQKAGEKLNAKERNILNIYNKKFEKATLRFLK